MRPVVFGWLTVCAMGAGSYMTPRPWRILFLAGLILSVVVLGHWQHRKLTVSTLRRIRHRQANHLQVIQGWLQLGRLNRAEDYVGRLSQKISEEGAWYRDLPLSWLYAVLMLDAMAESRGIRCQWHIAKVGSAWIRLFRFERTVARALASAGTAMDIHLDDQGFVVSLLDPKTMPRGRFGVRVWQQGDTIVLVWHPGAGTE
ncbi:MAG: Spo0B domain-containing protein [Firmicutes bacterium]|nr:Spo0B domain-containing protein [Bacillota bacterium]